MLRPALALAVGLLAGTHVAAANFTTAAEVKPILQATQSSWVAIRKFNGQDLLYFTQIESWRCGISQVTFRVNGSGQTYAKQMEPCYEETPAPNAFKLDSHVPYVAFPPDSLTGVEVTITFDDGSQLSGSFTRAQVALN